MKFLYDDEESIRSYKNSAYGEALKEMSDRLVPQKIGEVLNISVWEYPNGDGGSYLTPIEFAMLVASGKIREWRLFKTIYSIKLSQYLKGRSIPLPNRCGSTHLPEGGKRIFGKINGYEKQMILPNNKKEVEK